MIAMTRQFASVSGSVLSGVCFALLLLAVPFASSADDNTALMEELIVTANKREQNLQEVAAGVSLISGKALAEAHLRNAAELTTLLPTLNLQDSSDPGTSSFNIRGIGTRSFAAAIEPSVSTMLDGVVLARSGMAFMDLVDVERVEVLRGPQGSLYGKNASGGVIHIITRDPTPEWSGTVSATAIEEDEYRLDGTISGPVTDGLGFRLTGSAIDDDGWADNAYTGDKINNRESWSLRGKLLWQVDEDLELLWSSDYSDSDCNCTALSVRSVMASDQQDALLQELLPVVPADDSQDVNNDEQTINNITAWGHSLSVNWQLGEYRLTSITAYRDWDGESIVDLDRRPTNPLSLSFPEIPRTELQQFSQEFRVASDLYDWGSFVVGAFYFDQQIDVGNRTTAAVFAPVIPGTTRVTRNEVDSQNYALFGEVSINLADDWELTLGGRYTRDDLKFSSSQVGTDNLVFGPEVDAKDDTDEDDFSPKLALQWNVNDKAMVYASYTKGYKGPAFDVAGISPGGEAVDPETSDAYEIGLKSTWLDDRLVMNIAAFYAKYDDFQAESYDDQNPDDLLPGTFVLVNAGEVSTSGVEIEVFSQLTDNWTLFAGVSWIDAEIEDFPGGPCSEGQLFRGECPDDFQDLSGGDLPTTPEWKLNLSTTYTLGLESMPFDAVFNASMRAQDDVQYGIAQDEYTVQDSYTVVDASIALAGREQAYRLTLFVKNVFDEDYASIIFANPEALTTHSYIQLVPKYAERTAGVEVRYSF